MAPVFAALVAQVFVLEKAARTAEEHRKELKAQIVKLQVPGRGSRVEGRGLRVEGCGSRVEGRRLSAEG